MEFTFKRILTIYHKNSSSKNKIETTHLCLLLAVFVYLLPSFLLCSSSHLLTHPPTYPLTKPTNHSLPTPTSPSLPPSLFSSLFPPSVPPSSLAQSLTQLFIFSSWTLTHKWSIIWYPLDTWVCQKQYIQNIFLNISKASKYFYASVLFVMFRLAAT